MSKWKHLPVFSHELLLQCIHEWYQVGAGTFSGTYEINFSWRTGHTDSRIVYLITMLVFYLGLLCFKWQPDMWSWFLLLFILILKIDNKPQTNLPIYIKSQKTKYEFFCFILRVITRTCWSSGQAYKLMIQRRHKIKIMCLVCQL